MNISYSKDFVKAARHLNEAQSKRLKERMRLYLKEPNNTQLRNHKLSGQWSGYNSINITGDLRVVVRKTNDEIYFIALGTHAQLYK